MYHINDQRRLLSIYQMLSVDFVCWFGEMLKAAQPFVINQNRYLDSSTLSLKGKKFANKWDNSMLMQILAIAWSLSLNHGQWPLFAMTKANPIQFLG